MFIQSINPIEENFTQSSFSFIHKWDSTQTIHMKRGHWSEIDNQRHFMNAIASKLQISDPRDWYKITCKCMLQQKGGSGLLAKYKGSMSKLLATLYPEYRQACRDTVCSIVHDLKLARVEDLIHVPLQYPSLMIVKLITHVSPGAPPNADAPT